MKKVINTLIALTLVSPTLVFAHPGGGPGGPGGPGWHQGGGPGWGGGPRHYSFLPDAAAAVLIGGLTYYVLNGSYYQRQNNNGYVMVEPPVERYSGSMQALDYNGERFYVQDGHYYPARYFRALSGSAASTGVIKKRPPGWPFLFTLSAQPLLVCLRIGIVLFTALEAVVHDATGVVIAYEIGLRLTVTFAQYVSLAGTARVNHGDFSRGRAGNIANLLTRHSFLNILNNGLSHIAFGTVVCRTARQNGQSHSSTNKSCYFIHILIPRLLSM